MGDIVESCDLFSGLGLNAFAFRSFATPILYCEKDPAVRTILESVISRAILPAASIVRDVRSKACIIPSRARFVTASWPCQDTSIAGKRKGMEGPSGGLLTRVLKLVSSAPNVDVVFFENTPAAATNGSLATILDSLAHEFDCAWGRVCGRDVGRPQVRARFFCVCVRRCDEARALLRRCFERSAATELMESEAEPAARMIIPKQTKSNAVRSTALGNAVIPAASKKAFEVLSGFLLATASDSPHMTPVPAAAALEHWGAWRAGQRFAVRVPSFPRASAQLFFDPKFYSPPEGYVPRSVFKEGGLLSSAVFREAWPTPRRSNIGASHFLTDRSLRDLGTAVRFERGTPINQRCGLVKAEWIEWLMGVPQGYTIAT